MSELAEPFDMTLAAVVQHVQVLEQSGLIRTEKVGRVRSCSLEPDAFGAAESWFAQRRARWERRLDRLGELLADADEQRGSASAPHRAQRKRPPKTRRAKGKHR